MRQDSDAQTVEELMKQRDREEDAKDALILKIQAIERQRLPHERMMLGKARKAADQRQIDQRQREITRLNDLRQRSISTLKDMGFIRGVHW